MRFATAIPESYIKMTRTPPKKRNNKKKNKKKGGRSKKAVIEDLPLSKRWVLAATNAFRPSRENDANQLQVKKVRFVFSMLAVLALYYLCHFSFSFFTLFWYENE